MIHTLRRLGRYKATDEDVALGFDPAHGRTLNSWKAVATLLSWTLCAEVCAPSSGWAGGASVLAVCGLAAAMRWRNGVRRAGLDRLLAGLVRACNVFWRGASGLLVALIVDLVVDAPWHHVKSWPATAASAKLGLAAFVTLFCVCSAVALWPSRRDERPSVPQSIELQSAQNVLQQSRELLPPDEA